MFYDKLDWWSTGFKFEIVNMFIKYNVNPYRFIDKDSLFDSLTFLGIKHDDYKEYLGMRFQNCEFMEGTELEKDLKKSKLMGYF